ncbi:Hypothetical predicted protein, partial [Marmota monax]
KLRIQARALFKSLRHHLLEDTHPDPLLMMGMKMKMVVYSWDHHHKKAINSILTLLVLDTNTDHLNIEDISSDTTFLFLDPNEDQYHKEASSGILTLLVLLTNRDYHALPKEADHKDLPKANNLSKQNVND